MFTGIIESVGVVSEVRPEGDLVHLSIEAPEVALDVGQGDSVAVNGACLTVTEYGAGRVCYDRIDRHCQF